MLTGKTIIVTGASGNLGQAVSRKFLKEGYHVIGTSLSNDPVKLEIGHTKYENKVVDLMDESASEIFMEWVNEKYERIDAVVLTVGGFMMGSVAETKSSDIYRQYKLNFETAYHIARPALARMIKQGSGRIILVGSKPGLDAVHGHGMVAYGLTKSLIFRLAAIINEESKGKDIIASVLVPGTIDTPQNRLSMPDTDHSKWVKPEAIADTIFFYCSEAAAAIREPVIKLYNKS
jgi:NAD(P)-dependent dehydrogenase (short-subunit alcohol dehydrogenase family)